METFVAKLPKLTNMLMREQYIYDHLDGGIMIRGKLSLSYFLVQPHLQLLQCNEPVG